MQPSDELIQLLVATGVLNEKPNGRLSVLDKKSWIPLLQWMKVPNKSGSAAGGTRSKKKVENHCFIAVNNYKQA